MANEKEKTTSALEEAAQVVVRGKALLDDKLTKMNEALKSGTFEEITNAKIALDNALKSQNENIRSEVFARIETENPKEPLVAAIKKFYYTSLRLGEDKDENKTKVIAYKLVDVENTRIKLDEFVAHASLDKTWLIEVDKLLSLLQLRMTDIYTLKDSEISAKSFFFMQSLVALKKGETPTSNTKITAQIQKIYDDTIFVDNGEGKNKYKATVKDIAFVEDAAHMYDPKATCGLKSLKGNQFLAVMTSVLYAKLTDTAYTVKNAKVVKKEN